MALTNPSVSLLLAAGQPSSRRALVVGIGFAVALMICMGIGFTTLTHPWNVHNPGRLIVLLHFMITPGSSSDLLSLSLSPYVGTAALQASLLWGLAQVAAVWALVWAWEWRREHRA